LHALLDAVNAFVPQHADYFSGLGGASLDTVAGRLVRISRGDILRLSGYGCHIIERKTVM
jgi:hypothetical protein